MASWDIMNASILLIGIIEANPACEVMHGLGPCPIRKILMPGNDASMIGRFAKNLIMEKTESIPQ
jgi:hypothetical protein